MWAVTGQDVRMVEGDFGIELPIVIGGTTFSAEDEVKFVVKTAINGQTLVEKTFGNIRENTVKLVLTEQESDSLLVGSYVYLLDWYQSGIFMCNIIPWQTFKVVEKA